MLATTLPKNRNLSGLSPQFAAIARQLPPKFIILLPSLNAMLAVLWCAITSAFLLVVMPLSTSLDIVLRQSDQGKP